MSDHNPRCPLDVERKQFFCACTYIGLAVADERERIAQAIEARYPARTWLREVARIARNGGSNE